MVIGAGAPEHALARLVDGAPCTWFVATATPMTARKQWIAGSLRPAGNLTIDDGAWAALRAGKSLLPAGVTEVEGRFGRGDAVVVRDGAGADVARGLSAYAADDARRIKGHKSREIERILGYRGRDEMIHRDDLVLLKGA
jgi:glutamate 5-kinase